MSALLNMLRTGYPGEPPSSDALITINGPLITLQVDTDTFIRELQKRARSKPKRRRGTDLGLA